MRRAFEDADDGASRGRPALLVGIDTEGDNQWDLDARRNQTFRNVHALDRLHEFFERFAVRPTYLVTYPVVRDLRSAEVLTRLVQAGGCEIGAHHHAWETPPCDAGDVERHPYALSLPLARVEAQLESLTAAITAAVGVRPVSYRSGRFGFAAAHVSALERQGYLVDSSVVPLLYEAHKAGPDFVSAPLTPYFLSYDDATAPGSSGLLELPVSAALNRRVPAWLERRYGRAPWPYTTKRLMRLARLAHVRWLRPSYSSAEDMMTLGRQLTRRGVPLLNILFHSSEAIVGGSPYNRTEPELTGFFERLGRFLRFATEELGARPLTFAEFRRTWVSAGYRDDARNTA
jgi:peptidoglycan/xylan/chitin deacetylase (PgdA/CDA1 family)